MADLAKKIQNHIAINGPISVAEFMQFCLFDNESGYYNVMNPFGKSGDFVTSPEISQCFGEVIALYCLNYFINSDDKLQIIELGPGRGVLMQDMLRVFAKFPDFNHRISIHLVEKSPRLRKVQLEALEMYDCQINHYDDFNQIPQKLSFIVSNELLDCLPMQQFEFRNNIWFERKIDFDEKFFFRLCQTSASKIYPQLFLNKNISDGNILEISNASINLVREIAEFIQKTKSRGLLIDYGYTEMQYKPTLQALKNHKYQNVFENIGTQDLTYLVNFDILKQVVLEIKNCNCEIYEQGNFLESLGIKQRFEMCKKNKSAALKNQLDSALNRLISKDQMGSLFKVMELSNS